MTIVALTGGVAAGKSTVTEVLSSLGAHIIDADVLARKAVEPGTPAFEQIVARFGPVVVDESGGLDRSALGDIVFRDPQAREALNAIVHPQVKKLYDQALADASGTTLAESLSMQFLSWRRLAPPPNLMR
jgi:dephospho-CoA kinase